MSPVHTALEIIRDDEFSDPAEELEGPLMGRNPVRQTLRPGSLTVGVVRRTEDGDEDLGLAQLAGSRTRHGHGLPGIVDEELLAGAVGLPHDDVELLTPGTVVVTEPGVLVAAGVQRLVLKPQQVQRDGLGAFEFMVYLDPIRLRALAGIGGHREEASFEVGLVDLLGQRPAETGLLEAFEIVADGDRGDAQAASDGASAQVGLEVQAKDFSDLAHG